MLLGLHMFSYFYIGCVISFFQGVREFFKLCANIIGLACACVMTSQKPMQIIQ
jgi:hypothetical protein